RTVPPAHTLVRWVNEYAFVSIVQTRPCPTFGRPVHRWSRPHRLRPGTSPQALRIPPRGGHPALRSTVRGGFRSALAVSGFRLRARVGGSIPSALPGQRGVTPAFGYGAPHSSARGTSTLPNNALLSTHYGLLRLLRVRPGGLRSPLTTRYRSSAGTRRAPTFVGNPSESVPRARDSGGSRDPRITVPAIQPSAGLTASASATIFQFRS